MININNPLEDIKVKAALRSEQIKLEYRKTHKPEEINILDYTVITALEKQLNGGWIPVSERLPKEETGCLVWQKIDGHYKYNIWHYVTDFPSSVIAWQPLPEPFKEGENE